MGLKINKYLLLIILVLLQSCSGGRIGNFLESSFNNIEEIKTKEDNKKNNIKTKAVINSDANLEKDKNSKEIKIKEDNKKNNIKTKVVINSEANLEKNKNIKEIKTKEDDKKNNTKTKIIINSDKLSRNNKKLIKDKKTFQKRKYQPQSYKIIFILKDVDPKDPIEDLSTILRNSDVNFEIEKIERFFDARKKSIKQN